jgi:uncharacterized membrane protein
MALFRRPHLTRAQQQRVVAAIDAAERGHRGEIGVHLEARYTGDGPLARAGELFHSLGMDQTRDGTGVLLYVAVADRRAAVWAGPGVYGATAPEFWKVATDRVAQGFAEGQPAEGLVSALTAIGELLLTAAPGSDDAGDELPNRVTTS